MDSSRVRVVVDRVWWWKFMSVLGFGGGGG